MDDNAKSIIADRLRSLAATLTGAADDLGNDDADCAAAHVDIVLAHLPDIRDALKGR